MYYQVKKSLKTVKNPDVDYQGFLIASQWVGRAKHSLHKP